MPIEESAATLSGGCYTDEDDPVARALKTDPIVAAEALTGESYKTDKFTDALGVAMHMDHGEHKREILKAHKDTHYNMTFEEYLRVAGDIGFVIVQCRPFEYGAYRDKSVTLHNVVMVHPEGPVLIFDTYAWTNGEETVNGGKLLYNWKPGPEYRARQEEAWAMQEGIDDLQAARDKFPEDDRRREEIQAQIDAIFAESRRAYPPNVTSSGIMRNSIPEIPDELPNPNFDPKTDWVMRAPDGHPCNRYIKNPEFSRDQWVWVGDHDCREGLRHNFNTLKRWGSFVKPWIELPFGVDTMDLVESKERSEHSMWPPMGSDEYKRWTSEPMKPRQHERIQHKEIALGLELDDFERWPWQLVDAIGTKAIDAHWDDRYERIAYEYERHGWTDDATRVRNALLVTEVVT